MDIFGGESPSVTIGGSKITETGRLISLYGQTGAANTGSTFRRANASSGYQVPVGKKFRVVGVRSTIGTASATNRVSLGYADNDVGIASSTAFTNGVYIAGNAGAAAVLHTNAVGIYENTPFGFEIPAEKYPYVVHSGTTADVSTILFGFEEDA